jgi:elongation factor P
VVSTTFIRDFLIGEADIASFSCYSKPPASAGGAFTGGCMYSTTDFRKGLKIEVEGTPYEIVEFQHFKPGKGGAMVRTKLKNILTGRTQDITFRSGEKVEKPDLETREMQFLYREGSELIFMDLSTYEQLHMAENVVGIKATYLKDSQIVQVLLYQGSPLDIELPVSIVLVVTETEPGTKGDTVSNVTKPATLETGALVQVPLFVNIGDKVKVDTRSNEYLGRESS